VQIRGIPVGYVKEKKLKGEKAVLTVCLTEKVSVRKDAMLVIRPKSLLGERFVDLRPGVSPDLLPPPGPITRTLNPLRVEDLGEILDPLAKNVDFSQLSNLLSEIITLLSQHQDELSSLFTEGGKFLSSLQRMVQGNEKEWSGILKELHIFLATINSSLPPQEQKVFLQELTFTLREGGRFLKTLNTILSSQPEGAEHMGEFLKELTLLLHRLNQVEGKKFLLVLKKILQEEGITVKIFSPSEEKLLKQIQTYPLGGGPTTQPTREEQK